MTIKDTIKTYVLGYIPTQNDIDYVIQKATRNSLYAYQDDIKQGFLTYKGIRIGLSGRGVTDVDKLITIKDFSSLVIRIPREVLGFSQPLTKILDNFESTIIVSPPYSGKTTLIRDISRVLSRRYETLIIDERGEIYNENYQFGNNLDIFSDTPKKLIVEGLIRALSPEIIVLDELFSKSDLEVIREINRCGIRVLASAHTSNIEHFKKENNEIISFFVNAIELSNKPKVGTIKSIVRLQ